jgi:hypothetical protein
MSAAATSTSSWTTVTSSHRRTHMPTWTLPTVRAASAPTPASATRSFSFTTAAAALEETSLPPRAPVRMPSLRSMAPPQPKFGRVASAPAPAPALDISSQTQFPSLGGGGGGSSLRAASTTAPTTTSSWSSAVRDTPPSEAALAAEKPTPKAETPAEHRARLAAIGTRCFDDGPTDYDGPEEEYDGFEGEEYTGEDDGGTELNAELLNDRRAGDHSDW